MEYEIVVGLEVHAELATKTKAFCSCKNAFGDEVNTNVCPICLAMPGALPRLSEAVTDFAVRAGLALDCTVNAASKFDRKNYFYPDLTKGYQITQFDFPICEHGKLTVYDGETGEESVIRINRLHIEEDTAKLIHDSGFDGTLIDFNRCGVPLIEIVSEADMRSASQAKAYLETMRAVLVAVGVSDGKMQEGSIRCDVNVSVMPKGAKEFGTRVEMKNVNTFSGAMRAIEYESARQISEIESGGEIHQETRRWDDLQGKNFLMRTKENAQDYRYFPEPDLFTLNIAPERIEAIRAALPELPHARTSRLMREHALPRFDANLLVQTPEKADFFERCAALANAQPKTVANWLLGDVTRILTERRLELAQTKLTPQALCDMAAMLDRGIISSAGGKTLIEAIMFEDKCVADVVKEKGLEQISDTSALEALAASVLEQNPQVVEQYRGGKTNALGFLVGQCMKQSAGKGNPAVLKEILLGLLEVSPTDI